MRRAAHFANPQISVISLQTLLVLILGTITGIKVSIFIHGLIGFFGFFILSRQFKLSNKAAVLASIIFSFSGIVGSYLSTGMVVFINAAYMPYIFYFYNKSDRRKMYLLVSAGFMALSYYFGYNITLLMVVFLTVFTLTSSFLKRSLKPLIKFLFFLTYFFILSAPKLILSLQLFFIFPRLTIGHDHSGYKFVYLLYYLISRKQNLFELMDLPRYSFYIDENSLYVGILPIILFFIFFLKNRKEIKRLFPLLTTLGILLFLMSGYYAFPYIYAFLKMLPVFSSYQVAQRFRFDFIIIFSLIVGLGYDRFTRIVGNKKICDILFVLFVAVIYFDLSLFSITNFFRPTLIIKDNFSRDNTGPFVQKKSISDYTHYSYAQNIIPKQYENTDTFTPLSLEYVAIQNNIGTTQCYDSITEKIAAKPLESFDYRGEWYLKYGPGNVALKYWSPNVFIFNLTLNKPNQHDLLVVNQNYFPGWFVSLDGKKWQEAKMENGLIAAKVSQVNKTITFKFLPYRKFFGDIFSINITTK